MDEVLSVLRKVVGYSTISGQSNLSLLEYLSSFCNQMGGECHFDYNNEKDRANLICYFGPDKPDGLILSGHTDTVPPDYDRWKHSPFQLTHKLSAEGNDLYFGLGTSDMKAFLAISLVALKLIDPEKLQKPLVLVFTYDEEIGCQGIQKALEYMKNLPRFFPEKALVGEPTMSKICVAHKGHTHMKIKVKGVEGHSSCIDEGVSAIHWAGKILVLLEKYQNTIRTNIRQKSLFPVYPFNTLNVGLIAGGQAINIIPDECVLSLGYRTLPGDRPDELFENIKSIIEHELASDLRSLNNQCDIEYELEMVVPPMLTNSGSNYEKIIRKITGDYEQIAAPFTTEGGIISSYGIECFICGPGSIHDAHRPNEFISKDQIERGLYIVKKVIEELCC